MIGVMLCLKFDDRFIKPLSLHIAKNGLHSQRFLTYTIAQTQRKLKTLILHQNCDEGSNRLLSWYKNATITLSVISQEFLFSQNGRSCRFLTCLRQSTDEKATNYYADNRSAYIQQLSWMCIIKGTIPLAKLKKKIKQCVLFITTAQVFSLQVFYVAVQIQYPFSTSNFIRTLP